MKKSIIAYAGLDFPYQSNKSEQKKERYHLVPLSNPRNYTECSLRTQLHDNYIILYSF